MYSFRKAKSTLSQAKIVAETNNEKRLLEMIRILDEEIKDGNRNIRNYAEEFGLDLP